ncbi:hypothetical protein BLS_005828 [Venturia inaequalis]|uniref:Uncharacterized protein n=1 Tax=Venturia inaequalis TaxID=5025 RepID=A0A8H3V8Z3_VENIN|nr:hypothetical protein EG328_005467 [Venturia inaequalis]KAE9982579.1 hypothetical protein BLS_005828 [Venturia inaequalis]RDI79488.1 Aldolase [Venturia inaequalis]
MYQQPAERFPSEPDAFLILPGMRASIDLSIESGVASSERQLVDGTQTPASGAAFFQTIIDRTGRPRLKRRLHPPGIFPLHFGGRIIAYKIWPKAPTYDRT